MSLLTLTDVGKRFANGTEALSGLELSTSRKANSFRCWAPAAAANPRRCA